MSSITVIGISTPSGLIIRGFAALAGQWNSYPMVRHRRPLHALATLVCVDLYLRPGETLALKKENLIPPQPALGPGGRLKVRKLETKQIPTPGLWALGPGSRLKIRKLET